MTNTISEHVVTTREQLRTLYREPHAGVLNKERPTLDEETKRFIERSPFVLLGTVGADGTADVSPRGGPSGFVRVLDDQRIAICDLSGNNRLDSLENIVATGQVGLLFVMPGQGETVRLNGHAVISTDPQILTGFPDTLRTPKAAIVVDVATTFIHCAKAMQRSGIWNPDVWAQLADAPDGADIWAAQHPEEQHNPDDIRTALAEGYAVDLAGERATPAD